jgi:hypothetical protein
MSEDIKQHVDTNSPEFKQVATGLNSSKGTENWQAGNELGRELKDEGEKKGPVDENLFKEDSTPLFLRDSPEGNKENAQDEKDETEE